MCILKTHVKVQEGLHLIKPWLELACWLVTLFFFVLAAPLACRTSRTRGQILAHCSESMDTGLPGKSGLLTSIELHLLHRG